MAKLDPIVEFREDHRKVRDGLLDLAKAAEAGDVTKARNILGQIDTLVGPHFRYEEENLYPALKEFLGDYVDSLIEEHGGAIATAKVAAKVLSQSSISKEEGREVAKAARALLVHVSNCDGLNILAERFSPKKLDELGKAYAQARVAGVPLLRWADTIRKR
ncbi:MAG: hemerythrin domain-containing protein [Chloroflexi bacterium]|nr:hemerythrin domain-containing protein [Chloroflexota bacterium]MBI2980567.1 hemerythrin domain-containing protein [Chloroflexota bacterium]